MSLQPAPSRPVPPSTTVYVDVSCPNEPDWDGGGIGVGIVF
jgi:hypothetical protein